MVSGEHKRLVTDYLADLAKRAGAKEPEVLAIELDLLMEGAIVYAHVMGDKEAARRAKGMASLYVEWQFA